MATAPQGGTSGKRQRGHRGGGKQRAQGNATLTGPATSTAVTKTVTPSSTPQYASPAPQSMGTAFTFQPGSITCVLSRTSPQSGLISAWDSLRLANRPCGWALLKAGCRPKPGTSCLKSHDPKHQDAAAVAKVKAACTPDLLSQMH